MIRSFIQEARYLDKYLLNLQCDGYKIISVTPIEEKKYDKESRMYVDKNLFNIVAEIEGVKPVEVWRVFDEEFNTKQDAIDYAESKELDVRYYVNGYYEFIEAE